MKKSRKESELNTVDSQIRGLETRLRFAKTDMEGTVSTATHIYLFITLRDNCIVDKTNPDSRKGIRSTE